uniref:Cyclin N-terminal domain-containing protein n=1 Tax=Chromera velia CCMP2878 TaxID=1169474 RepID=A0A0G4I924_9ALVE|eukprot:Cvel_2009.t1-p1 / transcript=Cvel_2009.t1 / gene=Cvel_2009 / organism=Chromera_velia_CCMP2878 / gene_product=G2/mitotic-specific cyclin-B, putative / transcript_product=G2/mitotic-specific cyclin-B, putative / location=Cvel_scaffold77:22406-30918(+) / protein_length=1864 / sequence_SO=supercontig / SO=protein_coding / is_pseudo=false
MGTPVQHPLLPHADSRMKNQDIFLHTSGNSCPQQKQVRGQEEWNYCCLQDRVDKSVTKVEAGMDVPLHSRSLLPHPSARAQSAAASASERRESRGIERRPAVMKYRSEEVYVPYILDHLKETQQAETLFLRYQSQRRPIYPKSPPSFSSYRFSSSSIWAPPISLPSFGKRPRISRNTAEQLMKTDFRLLPSVLERHPSLTPENWVDIINFYIEEQLRRKLQAETVWLAYSLLSRFLAHTPIELSRNEFALAAAVSYWTASKTEDVLWDPADGHPDIVLVEMATEMEFSRDEIRQMETLLLNTVDWNLTAPTAWNFLTIFSELAGLGDEPRERRVLCRFVLECCLLDPALVACLPSDLAGAALHVGMRVTSPWGGRSDPELCWSPLLAKSVGRSLADICLVAERVADCVSETFLAGREEGRPGEHILRKYSVFEQCYVSVYYTSRHFQSLSFQGAPYRPPSRGVAGSLKAPQASSSSDVPKATPVASSHKEKDATPLAAPPTTSTTVPPSTAAVSFATTPCLSSAGLRTTMPDTDLPSTLRPLPPARTPVVRVDPSEWSAHAASARNPVSWARPAAQSLDDRLGPLPSSTPVFAPDRHNYTLRGLPPHPSDTTPTLAIKTQSRETEREKPRGTSHPVSSRSHDQQTTASDQNESCRPVPSLAERSNQERSASGVQREYGGSSLSFASSSAAQGDRSRGKTRVGVSGASSSGAGGGASSIERAAPPRASPVIPIPDFVQRGGTLSLSSSSSSGRRRRRGGPSCLYSSVSSSEKSSGRGGGARHLPCGSAERGEGGQEAQGEGRGFGWRRLCDDMRVAGDREEVGGERERQREEGGERERQPLRPLAVSTGILSGAARRQAGGGRDRESESEASEVLCHRRADTEDGGLSGGAVAVPDREADVSCSLSHSANEGTGLPLSLSALPSFPRPAFLQESQDGEFVVYSEIEQTGQDEKEEGGRADLATNNVDVSASSLNFSFGGEMLEEEENEGQEEVNDENKPPTRSPPPPGVSAEALRASGLDLGPGMLGRRRSGEGTGGSSETPSVGVTGASSDSLAMSQGAGTSNGSGGESGRGRQLHRGRGPLVVQSADGLPFSLGAEGLLPECDRLELYDGFHPHWSCPFPLSSLFSLRMPSRRNRDGMTYPSITPPADSLSRPSSASLGTSWDSANSSPIRGRGMPGPSPHRVLLGRMPQDPHARRLLKTQRVVLERRALTSRGPTSPPCDSRGQGSEAPTPVVCPSRTPQMAVQQEGEGKESVSLHEKENSSRAGEHPATSVSSGKAGGGTRPRPSVTSEGNRRAPHQPSSRSTHPPQRPPLHPPPQAAERERVPTGRNSSLLAGRPKQEGGGLKGGSSRAQSESKTMSRSCRLSGVDSKGGRRFDRGDGGDSVLVDLLREPPRIRRWVLPSLSPPRLSEQKKTAGGAVPRKQRAASSGVSIGKGREGAELSSALPAAPRPIPRCLSGVPVSFPYGSSSASLGRAARGNERVRSVLMQTRIRIDCLPMKLNRERERGRQMSRGRDTEKERPGGGVCSRAPERPGSGLPTSGLFCHPRHDTHSLHLSHRLTAATSCHTAKLGLGGGACTSSSVLSASRIPLVHIHAHSSGKPREVAEKSTRVGGVLGCGGASLSGTAGGRQAEGTLVGVCTELVSHARRRGSDGSSSRGPSPLVCKDSGIGSKRFQEEMAGLRPRLPSLSTTTTGHVQRGAVSSRLSESFLTGGGRRVSSIVSPSPNPQSAVSSSSLQDPAARAGRSLKPTTVGLSHGLPVGGGRETGDRGDGFRASAGVHKGLSVSCTPAVPTDTGLIPSRSTTGSSAHEDLGGWRNSSGVTAGKQNRPSLLQSKQGGALSATGEGGLISNSHLCPPSVVLF